MIGVYKIECIPNGKVYVGSSTKVFGRLNTHFKELIRGYQSYDFQHDFYKYGISNFSITILEVCEEENRFEREKYYMDFYDCLNPENGYNRQKLGKMGVR